jgi:hypothetical protein
MARGKSASQPWTPCRKESTHPRAVSAGRRACPQAAAGCTFPAWSAAGSPRAFPIAASRRDPVTTQWKSGQRGLGRGDRPSPARGAPPGGLSFTSAPRSARSPRAGRDAYQGRSNIVICVKALPNPLIVNAGFTHRRDNITEAPCYC